MTEIIINATVPNKMLYFLNTPEKLRNLVKKKLKPLKVTNIEIH